jgi:hypothetical protein
MVLETLHRTGLYFVFCYVLFGFLAAHVYLLVWLIQYTRFGWAIVNADTDWKAQYIGIGYLWGFTVGMAFLWPVFLKQSMWEQLKASIPQRPESRKDRT